MKKIQAQSGYADCLRAYGISLSECVCLSFEAGEAVIRQGEQGEFLYFIVEGSAQVQVLSPDGNVLSLGYTVSEGALGEVELLRESEAATATVIAETKLICLAYPYRQARLRCERDVRFVRQLSRDLAEKLSRSTGSLLSASFAPAESRMCAYLLREASDGIYRGTLTKAAAATGISYRHLQRVMIGLHREGIVEKTGGGYRILNPEELKERANA